MVTSDPLGFACATDCAQHVSAGARVTLTARPASGLVLAGWSGACASAGTAPTCTVTMAGIDFRALDNGFSACGDAQALAAICARLSHVDVLALF